MPRMMSESPRAHRERAERALCVQRAAMILKMRHEDPELIEALDRVADEIANEAG